MQKEIVNYFSKLMIFAYAGEIIGFVLMIVMFVFGKTSFPRGCAFITPGILMLFKPVVLKIPGMAGKMIFGGWSNLISIIYYTVMIVIFLVG